MEIIHRISIASSPEIQSELGQMGIQVNSNRELLTFEVNESHESWPKVERWIARRRPLDMISTEFSKQEIANAQWLELRPDWHHGYPQPDEDVAGYLEVTYDLSGFCRECGTGLRQKVPFQMKGEPKWGRNDILQLNWIFDEYFVTPPIWTKVFEPRGIAYRPVVNRKGAELHTVVQLVVTEETDIVTDGLSFERCEKCRQVKYAPIKRGPFPALAEKPRKAMTKTKQYFGSGSAASKRVIVSQELAKSLVAEGVRGASLRPLAE